MQMEQSKWSKWARVIAEDMTNLAIQGKFEASHFPISGSVVIDALPDKTLVKMVRALQKLPEGSIPYGFTLLFLMPRKIPTNVKKNAFKQILLKLSKIRADPTLRTSMELEYIPYEIPKRGVELSTAEYRKLVFLLDNMTEIRVPIYRGWSFDAFAHNGRFYRIYNIGTLKAPKYIVLSGKLINNPSADVFGHIKSPERVLNTWIHGAKPEETIQRVEKTVKSARNLETLEEKIEFVIQQWGKFLGVALPREYTIPQRKTERVTPELASRYRDATYKALLDLLRE